MADDSRTAGAAPALARLTRKEWQQQASNPVLGILLLSLAMAAFPLMDGIGKILVVQMHVLQIVWLRYAVQFAFCLPVALARHPHALFRPQALGLQVLRGVLGLVTISCFIKSLETLPLADALAVSFINPFIITALSPWVLGERVGIWRWSAVLTGFIGVLIIIKPGFATFSPGVLYALGAGCSYAAVILITRRVAGSDPAVITMTLMGFFACLASLAFLPWIWRWPTLQEWQLILVVGAIGTFCQTMVVLAYERATTAELAPFSYVEVVSAAFIGLWLFGDWPDALAWIGIAVIIGSGLVIAWREAVRSRKPQPSISGDLIHKDEDVSPR